jgi:hypothetical protein
LGFLGGGGEVDEGRFAGVGMESEDERVFESRVGIASFEGRVIYREKSLFDIDKLQEVVVLGLRLSGILLAPRRWRGNCARIV